MEENKMGEIQNIPLDSDVANSFRETLKQVLQSIYPDATITLRGDKVILEDSLAPSESGDGYYHKVTFMITDIKMR